MKLRLALYIMKKILIMIENKSNSIEVENIIFLAYKDYIRSINTSIMFLEADLESEKRINAKP